jgi:hypothetical protein
MRERGDAVWGAMRLYFALPFLLASTPALAQVTPIERTYGERVAMRAVDQRCNLFASGPRRALAGFTAQARGAALRAGASLSHLNLIARQSTAAVATKPCADPAIQAEKARVVAAHKGWRAQMTTSYPGPVRTWQVDRTGMDMWRATQETNDGIRAGFVGQGNGLAFAVETSDINAAGARLFLRDAARIGDPSPYARLTPPLRVGTTAHVAALRRAADTRPRIGAPARAGTMLVFTQSTTQAVLIADPRDSFEIEITSRTGQISRTLVEVGDIVAAFAFAAEF